MKSIYVKWLLFALLGILVSLANYLLAPIIALFINKDGYLPKWLNWFQTPDNPAYGDKLFRHNQMNDSTNDYWCGVVWATRNPGYGYDNTVGITVKEGFTATTDTPEGLEWIGEWYDPMGSHINKVLKEGVMHRTLTQEGTTYFEWVLIRKWSATRYLKLKFGWALYQPFKVGEKRGLEFTISPFMAI